jgi:hypothetical protein
MLLIREHEQKRITGCAFLALPMNDFKDLFDEKFGLELKGQITLNLVCLSAIVINFVKVFLDSRTSTESLSNSTIHLMSRSSTLSC